MSGACWLYPLLSCLTMQPSRLDIISLVELSYRAVYIRIMMLLLSERSMRRRRCRLKHKMIKHNEYRLIRATVCRPIVCPALVSMAHYHYLCRYWPLFNAFISAYPQTLVQPTSRLHTLRCCYFYLLTDDSTLWRPLLPYGYSCKASCVRSG